MKTSSGSDQAPLPSESPPTPVLPTALGSNVPTNEVPQAAVAHAERLVEELGSVELAKHAVDLAKQAVEAVANQGEPNATETELDQLLGYATHQALLDASSPIESGDGKKWYLTHLSDDSWVAWNEVDCKADRHFVTVEEARASVPHVAGFTGSSTLG